MRILVTGGAGFIGSHIVDSYIDHGHEVVVVDNLSSGRENNINSRAEFVRLSLQDNELEKVFSDFQFDIVNHHAAQIDVRKSVSEPMFDAEVNILGTLNLLENCVKYQIKKFVFASTGGAVYGEQDVFPADESHPTRPVSPYGINKLCCEKYLYYYHALHNICYVILRYANVYGPRQSPHGEAGVVAIFTNMLMNNKTPTINGDGSQTRDYVFVEDVVGANLLALTHEHSDVYNISTSKETDVNTLFSLLNQLTEANAVPNYGLAKPGEQLRSCLSFLKAENKLGWKPEVELAKGLSRTVEYFGYNAESTHSKESVM